MPRPSKQTDLALIEAGKKLLPLHGLSGLSIRKVAEEAGVNLGMFHYHFKTKEQFAHAVMQHAYEEFFAVFSARLKEGAHEPDPTRRLTRLIETVLVELVCPNRKMLVSTLRDVLNGDKYLLSFLAANVPRHLKPILGVVNECRERKLFRTDLTLAQTMIQLFGGVAGPVLIGTIVERVGGRLVPKSLTQQLVGESAGRTRIDFVIAGLKAGAK